MSERISRLSRRHFLLAAGAGSATAAALVAQKATGDAKRATSSSKRSTAGYVETDHVRDYYRTAKV